MSYNGFDLVANVNIDWCWEREPMARNSSFNVRRQLNEDGFHEKVILVIDRNPDSQSMAYHLLIALINFLTSEHGNHNLPLEIRVPKDNNYEFTVRLLETEVKMAFTYTDYENTSVYTWTPKN